MGTAFQCDRCTRLEPGTPTKRVTVEPTGLIGKSHSIGKQPPVELCADCTMKLDSFLKAHQEDMDRA